MPPLDKPAKSGVVTLSADSRAHHTFPQFALFLADYPEQCMIPTLNHRCCHQCEICLGDMPSFAHRIRRHNPKQYVLLSTTAVEEVGLRNFADLPNFAEGHAGFNKYCCMNIVWLHQGQKDMYEGHGREWIICCRNDIEGLEQYLYLMDERFSIICCWSEISPFGNKVTHPKQWTSAKYKNMVKVWLARLLEGHSDHFKFIKLVTDFMLIASYNCHIQTMVKYLQDALSCICSKIHLFLPYCKSHSLSRIPKIQSLLHCIECIRKLGSANIVTPKCLNPLTNTSSTMTTVFLTRCIIFCRCYNGKRAYFISSLKSVVWYISVNQIPTCRTY